MKYSIEAHWRTSVELNSFQQLPLGKLWPQRYKLFSATKEAGARLFGTLNDGELNYSNQLHIRSLDSNEIQNSIKPARVVTKNGIRNDSRAFLRKRRRESSSSDDPEGSQTEERR